MLNGLNKIRAIIFDMDGVLIDSELHWRETENRFIKVLIPHWNETHRQKIIGKSVDDIHEYCVLEHQLNLNEEGFRDMYNENALPIYEKKASVLPGCRELLRDLKKQALKLALASSARRNWIEKTLRRHRLKSYFQAVVSAEELKGKGKPEPEIFLRAAEALGISPAECLVIEDSTNGLLAAKRAGMVAIGLRNGFNQEQNLKSADAIIKGFVGLDWQKLKNLEKTDLR